MSRKKEVLQDVVIKFAGDSGDGMQLTGSQFTNNTALMGIDLATFPDFPAEIRAPQGTLPGVSGFQLRFSSDSVYTPGDAVDVLVAMNAAALKVNLTALKKGGKIIANIDGFDAKNLRLANYPEGENPLENGSLDGYDVIKMDVTKMTREALKDISLKIKKGQTIAIVGHSGGGKSTMADLLPRFIDPVRGEVFIDGVNIRDIKMHNLHKLMGIVSQQAVLFNDSFKNNIAFGVDNIKDEDIVTAAKIANAHEFIIDNPEGYDGLVGEGGNKLSGGQRQRVSIARAVMANPPILILDEATSALDTESEKLVQDAMDKLMQNRTSIVIAHRLSTIQHADLIAVVEDGRIVETGKHEDLIKIPDGIYQRLYKLQSF